MKKWATTLSVYLLPVLVVLSMPWPYGDDGPLVRTVLLPVCAALAVAGCTDISVWLGARARPAYLPIWLLVLLLLLHLVPFVAVTAQSREPDEAWLGAGAGAALVVGIVYVAATMRIAWPYALDRETLSLLYAAGLLAGVVVGGV